MATRMVKGLDGLKAAVNAFKGVLIEAVAIKLAGHLVGKNGDASGRFEWTLREHPKNGIDARIEVERRFTQQMGKDYLEGKTVSVPITLVLTVNYEQKLKKVA
jgi:hypothetical protein